MYTWGGPIKGGQRSRPALFHEVHVDKGLKLKVDKKLDSVHYMKVTTMEYMIQWSQHLQIFTDGSKYNNTTACGFYIPALKYGKSIRLSDFSSVFNAELVAILKSLQFFEDRPPFQMAIFLDSLSSLQAIEGGSSSSDLVKEIQYQLYMFDSQGINVSFIWLLTEVLDVHYLISKVFATGISLIWNFFARKIIKHAGAIQW